MEVRTRAEIAGVVSRFADAMRARDFEAVLELFADDPELTVWTGSDNPVSGEEPLIGRQQVRAFLEILASAGTTTSLALEPSVISSHGDVGWIAAHGVETDVSRDGSEETYRYRMTGVMRQTGNGWKIVQWHGSLPHVGET